MEDLNKKYQHLFNTVKKLRHWQREVDEYHQANDKQVVKMLEKEIDGIIRQAVREEKAKNLIG